MVLRVFKVLLTEGTFGIAASLLAPRVPLRGPRAAWPVGPNEGVPARQSTGGAPVNGLYGD